jgi:hypothetical protein
LLFIEMCFYIIGICNIFPFLDHYIQKKTHCGKRLKTEEE